jgi:FemAB-related protein (PEP-CTERM system-associated)
MNVRLAGLHDVERWNEFAVANGGSVFHSYEWGDVIEHSFEYKRLYLLAEEDGKISGILPLFYLKCFLSGRRLVSLPVSDAGGPLGSKDAARELLNASQQIMLDCSADYIELKGKVLEEDYVAGRRYPAFVLELPSSEEQLLDVIGKKNRNLTRKAEKEGVTVDEARDSRDVASFYDVYARTMKQLGTPPYPCSFYGFIHSLLTPKKKAVILLARRGNEVIGGAVFFFFGATVHYFTGVSPKENLPYSPNTLLVYRGLTRGVTGGFKSFDFGRTSTEGVYNFKKSWGGTEREVVYYYKLLNPEKKIPGGKIQTLSSLWRTIVPLRIANLVGPHIRKNFGF